MCLGPRVCYRCVMAQKYVHDAVCGQFRPRRVVIDGVGSIELLPAAPYEAAFTPAGAVIGFAYEAQSGTHAFASDRKTPFQAKPNHLSFVPIGCDVYSQSKTGGEYLRIVLDSSHSELARREQRFSNIIDHQAIGFAEELRRLLIGGLHDDASIEHLISVLSGRALETLSGEIIDERGARWMTPRRLRLSMELIEEHLSTKLTISQLAHSLGLSSGFFSRTFRNAVGKAPHDYIVDRRIARARILLEIGQCDLSDIALAVGFSSHAHMTSAFKRRLGTTPSKLRAASGGLRG
jgi:AraC family transcriptional regulator